MSDEEFRRGQFPNARDLTPEERERNGRLGTLFEDIIGSETGVVRVPDGAKLGDAQQLEGGSTLGFLKAKNKIRGYMDLRPVVKEHFQQERTHGKPDFWILLVDGQECELEVKNFGKKMKDNPRPGYPPWFTRTDRQAKVDIDIAWNPRSRRSLAVSWPIYTDSALKYFEDQKVSFAAIGNDQVTENSDLIKVRDFAAADLYTIFSKWMAVKA